MLNRLLNKWWEKIITYFFEREFRYFSYPFEQLDYLIEKLPEDERFLYYQDIKRYSESKAFTMEMTEMKKMFYKELSISTTNEIERAGYRLCLLFLRKIEHRYKYLNNRYYVEEKVGKIKHKI